MQSNNQIGKGIVCLFLDLGLNFHLEFYQYKFRNLPRFFCLNKLNFLYCLNETIFSPSYALSTRFTIKQKVSARKVWWNASDKFGFNPLSTSWED